MYSSVNFGSAQIPHGFDVAAMMSRDKPTRMGSSRSPGTAGSQVVGRQHDVTAFDPRRVKGDCGRLLAVILDEAHVVPVLPDDVRTVSDIGGKGLGGENHSDRDGDTI